MQDGQVLSSSRKASVLSETQSAKADGKRAGCDVRLRVVIADDDPIILDQIGSLLCTRFEVVARAANGRALVAAVEEFSPAVVVSDLIMPVMNGIEATRLITKACPDVKVVVLSVHSDPAYVVAAFEAGASGYVLKLGAFSNLIPAIEDVLAGKLYRPPQIE